MVGALFRGRDREPAQEIPVDRLHRVQRSFRRRLSDQVEDVLHRACVEDDLQTAEHLYKLLTAMQHRRKQAYGVERRVNDEGLVKAGQAVELCRMRNKNSPQAPSLDPGMHQAAGVTSERYCPFYRYLMVYAVHATAANPKERSGRRAAPYQAIGHYTFPPEETLRPPRSPVVGT